jgi:hypothetical protein
VAELRSYLGELERRLAETTDALERKEIEAEMETTRGRIAKLNGALEEAFTGGITATALVDEPAERINWRAELEKSACLILASPRDLTEKPRWIDELRGEIEPGGKTHGRVLEPSARGDRRPGAIGFSYRRDRFSHMDFTELTV